MKQLITLLLLICNITAQAQDNSLLWRISGNKLTKPSYLFGTIHLICPEDYVWTKPMAASLAASDKVCFEMNLADPSIMMQVAAGMIDNSGKKLSDYFTPQQYQVLTRYVKDTLHMDIALLEKMKPIMLDGLISTTSINCENPISYEDSLMKMAQAAHKPILGLEEPREQIDALEQIPIDSLIASLMEDIQSAGKTDTEYEKMLLAYKQQDLPGLYDLVTNSPGIDNEKGALLDDRNKKWVSRIAAKSKSASVFYAVGAGHLYGQAGVIALLRKAGYKVEPVK